ALLSLDVEGYLYPFGERCGWDARTGKMRASRSHKGADDGTQHQETGDAKATPLHSRAAAAPPDRAGRHAQGRMAVSRRCGAQNLASRRAALSRPRHQPRGARPARRADAARGGEDRPPRPDRVSLHRPGAHLEGSRAAAGVRQNRGRQGRPRGRSEEHTSELQSLAYLVCRLLLEKKKKKKKKHNTHMYQV